MTFRIIDVTCRSELLALSPDFIGIDQAANLRPEKGNQSMTKSPEIISEIIRNPKHPFRKADDRPLKAQKHRYERRKIKEYIRMNGSGEEIRL